MTRIVKVLVPAKLVFRLDELDLEDLSVMGKDVWLRRSRDGSRYTSYSFAEDDARAKEVLDYVRDACGSALQVVDVTAQYAFETPTAPKAFDFDSNVDVCTDEHGRTVAVLRRLRHRQRAMYARATLRGC